MTRIALVVDRQESWLNTREEVYRPLQSRRLEVKAADTTDTE